MLAVCVSRHGVLDSRKYCSRGHKKCHAPTVTTSVVYSSKHRLRNNELPHKNPHALITASTVGATALPPPTQVESISSVVIPVVSTMPL